MAGSWNPTSVDGVRKAGALPELLQRQERHGSSSAPLVSLWLHFGDWVLPDFQADEPIPEVDVNLFLWFSLQVTWVMPQPTMGRKWKPHTLAYPKGLTLS